MAATNNLYKVLKNIKSNKVLLIALFLFFSQSNSAAILPKERADIMYHRYDGGGMVIDGPSVLVRKNFADKVSASLNYYVDKVSSASIDVITITQGASKYSEERTEKSGDISYLHDSTTFNAGYTTSSENDYEAESYRFDVSHSFFSEMITVNAGYSQGNDDISSSEDDTLQETLERRHYRLGIAQVLSKRLIANLNIEAIIDEGYLQNPYRRILETDTNTPNVYSLNTEFYPSTRNSEAISLKFSYHLPWSAAIKTRFGYYSDSWEINGYSFELDYSTKIKDRWLIDLRLRHYQQSDADFYANTFEKTSATVQNFKARDKELSEYSSQSIGLGISYKWQLNSWIESISLNSQVDYLLFSYDNFREVTPETTSKFGVGNEPLYEFDAYALRAFLTLTY